MDCRSGVYSEVQRRAHEQTVITKSLSLSLGSKSLADFQRAVQ
jgi:hypothetical protein